MHVAPEKRIIDQSHGMFGFDMRTARWPSFRFVGLNMTVASLIISRWIIVNGRPLHVHRLDGVRLHGVPTISELSAFVFEQFQQPVSLSMATRVIDQLTSLAK